MWPWIETSSIELSRAKRNLNHWCRELNGKTMQRDYQRILRVDGQAFVTAQGTWRARVKEYSAPVSAANLLHLNIEFELEASESRKRELDLWIEDAPDVTLVAESVGMLEAINRWLERSDGDDDLLYDSGLRELVPSRQ
jgi:hypothetical protein